MNGDRNKLVLTILAGVWGLGVLVLGYFLWDASSAKSEAAESLEGEEANLGRYYSAKLFPSAKTSDAVNANATKVKAWREAARATVSTGDKTFDANEGASAFKERLLAEVRAMQAEPAANEKKVCAPKFLFGFERYLGEANEMPAAADLPQLQVELDFVRFIVERVVETWGASKREGDKAVSDIPDMTLDGVERLGPVAKAAAPVKKTNAKAKKAAAGAEVPDERGDAWRFRLHLTARPASFVRFLNAVTADPRFVSVADLAFRMKTDPVSARFAEESKRVEGGGGRRGRRGRRASEETEAPKKDDGKTRLVTDPARDAVYGVDMEVVLRDFGSHKAAKDDGAAKEAGK